MPKRAKFGEKNTKKKTKKQKTKTKTCVFGHMTQVRIQDPAPTGADPGYDLAKAAGGPAGRFRPWWGPGAKPRWGSRGRRPPENTLF